MSSILGFVGLLFMAGGTYPLSGVDKNSTEFEQLVIRIQNINNKQHLTLDYRYIRARNSLDFERHPHRYAPASLGTQPPSK